MKKTILALPLAEAVMRYITSPEGKAAYAVWKAEKDRKEIKTK